MSGIDRETIVEALARAEYDANPIKDEWLDPLPWDEVADAYRKGAYHRADAVLPLIRQARYDALTEAAEAIDAEIGPLIEVDTFAGGYDCCGCSTYRDIVDHAKRLVCSLRDQEGA